MKKVIITISLIFIFAIIFDMSKINFNYINKPLIEINRHNINSSFIKNILNYFQTLNKIEEKNKKFDNSFSPFELKNNFLVKTVNKKNFKAFSKSENEFNFSDWTRSHGNNQSNRFSNLENINKLNVKNLKKKWDYTFDKKFDRDVQCNPIVKKGIIYSATNGGSVIALDGSNGKLLWENKEFTYYVARRGMVISSSDRIYFADNKHLISLDAKNGTFDEKFGKNGKVKLDGSSVVAPIIYKNLIVTVTFDKTIEAYDQVDGSAVWKFSFEDPNNNKIVNGQNYINTGGNPWGGISVDTKRGILFITTGNPSYYFDGTKRPGLNKYSNSIIAFDLNQKKIIWDFQEVFHDIWNLDIPAAPILTSVMLENKKKLDVVVAVTKLGNTFILDRLTGESLYDLNYQLVPKSKSSISFTSKFQINQKIPEPFSKSIFKKSDISNRNKISENYILELIEDKKLGFFNSFEIGKKNILYNFHGGAEWPGASIDHQNNIMYVTSNEIAWIGELKKSDKFKGKLESKFKRLKDKEGYPGTLPPWGKITAINLNNGKILWQRPFGDYAELNFIDSNGNKIETGTENFGGVTGSRGGLLFATGTLDHKFYVYNSSNGEKLFETKLPFIGSAPPTIYEVNGKQYILVVATGSTSLKIGYPEKLEFGNKLIAFSLH